MRVALWTSFALVASPALAADVLPAPPNSPPAMSWMGFYAGVQAGLEASATDQTYLGDSSVLAAAANRTVPFGYRLHPSGFIGGLQAGYNYQFGNFVLGAEADWSWLSGKETSTWTSSPGPGVSLTATAQGQVDWLSTIRMRAGVSFENLFIYLTGGLALGSAKSSGTIALFGVPVFQGSDESQRAGWALGAGAEYALSQHWSVKADYLYYDLGHSQYIQPQVSQPPLGILVTTRASADGNLVRVGLNYRF